MKPICSIHRNTVFDLQVKHLKHWIYIYVKTKLFTATTTRLCFPSGLARWNYGQTNTLKLNLE